MAVLDAVVDSLGIEASDTKAPVTKTSNSLLGTCMQTAIALSASPMATLGECPRWDEKSKRLYWVDIDGFALHAIDPATSQLQTRQIGQSIGSFALREAGGFVLALRSGYALLDSFDGPIRALPSPSWDTAIERFNDGRCDPQGRFWAGTMYEPRDKALARLYRLDSDLTWSVHGAGVTISNGIAVSPDQSTFYFADTPTHTVLKHDFDPVSGTLGSPTLFLEFPDGKGRPDGATVDQAGNYWIALFSGSRVQCYSPSGQLLEEIAVPTKNPTCLTFGGDDLRTLYITTAKIRLTAEELAAQPDAGRVFTARTAIAGLIEPRFKG